MQFLLSIKSEFFWILRFSLSYSVSPHRQCALVAESILRFNQSLGRFIYSSIADPGATPIGIRAKPLKHPKPCRNPNLQNRMPKSHPTIFSKRYPNSQPFERPSNRNPSSWKPSSRKPKKNQITQNPEIPKALPAEPNTFQDPLHWIPWSHTYISNLPSLTPYYLENLKPKFHQITLIHNPTQPIPEPIQLKTQTTRHTPNRTLL